MPCGHTDPEFAQFTKTERRILRMVEGLMTREAILAALEITDSTLRMHLANIKRKQAGMRVARAQAATLAEEQRLRERYIPELPQEAPEVEQAKPLPFVSLHRSPPIVEPPPIARPVLLPPVKEVRQNPFVDLSVPQQKKKTVFGAFKHIP